MDLRNSLLGAALAAATTVGAWGWWQRTQLLVEQKNAEGLTQQLATAETEARRNRATATALQSTLEHERQVQAQLRKLQSTLRTGLAERERLIESLKHDNETLRNWADQPLPDAARRLRERPAITGADAYRQWLSSGSAVPTAGDHAGNERPSAQ